MLAEQAAENAAKVEAAYGGMALGALLLSTLTSFSPPNTRLYTTTQTERTKTKKNGPASAPAPNPKHKKKNSQTTNNSPP